MSPLQPLTIVTVCRNEVGRIGRTRDSLLLQEDQDFEWVIVDGASVDGTTALLNDCPRVNQLISEPDRGIYDAMNKGILAARGDFILFLNAGDRLADRHVTQAFHRHPRTSDIVVGNLHVAFPDGSAQHRKASRDLLTHDALYWRTLPHPATFVRRSLFTRLGNYDDSYRLAGDWEFFARAIVRSGATSSILEHDVAIFTHDGASARPENKPILRRERRRLLRSHYPVVYRWRRDFNEAWGALLRHLRPE